MIWYVVTEQHAYTLRDYLKTWGLSLAGRFCEVTYDELFSTNEFEGLPGAYIFSDIERLYPPHARYAAMIRQKLLERQPEARVFNHPTRSMRRYELLRTLFERGDNTFNVYRLVECRRPERWPVFIREENEHTKNLTPLLHTPEELDAETAKFLERVDSREDKLVVEFCDTRDAQGLFYRYSAYLIGGRVIPNNLIASYNWTVESKVSIWTPEVLEQERRYMMENPHERELREIFRLARIDYGRIDYSMLGDRLQVWEINTNPNITSLATLPDDTERKHELHMRADRIAAAFVEIDTPDDANDAIVKDVSNRLDH